MVLKIIDATEAKVGTNITLEGETYTVKKMDVSKTGKHGHAKVRLEAVNIMNDNKKVFVVPGHERFDVPLINKRKGQVLTIGDKVSVMDLESFETLEIDCPEDLRSQMQENSNVEYWEINGQMIIKRVQ
ncbi:translation initiation factor IF-5A [Candidatus Pacearchaeota archaeon]|nr:translation initiation factor IF-5A [Candidatus Pacearchaeota archaeon]